MNRVQLVRVIFESMPKGVPSEQAHRDLERALAALAGQLERFPGARLALHLSGGTFERLLSRRSPVVERLRQAVGRGQLELLGGTWSGPILTIIPERDLAAQLRRTARLVASVTGSEPAGFWLGEQVWEPSLAIQLPVQGVPYTFLSDTILRLGLPGRPAVDGIWTIERLGFRLPVFATTFETEERLRAACPEEILRQLAFRAGEEPVLTWASPIEAFCRAPDLTEAWGVVLERREESAPWLELWLPGELAGRQRPRGQVWLPTAMRPGLARRAADPELELAWERTNRQSETDGELSVDRRMAQALPFEQFFRRYPEINRLHKKMLLTSSRLHRLARLVQERQARGDEVSTLVAALERAQLALLEAQNHAAWWPGPEGGCYRPELRETAWRRLLEAQRVADAVFFPEPRWVSIEHLDFHRDGGEDLLLANPGLDLGLSLLGGALFELSYKPRPWPLADLLGRRFELEHERLRAVGVAEPGRKGEPSPPGPVSDREAALEPRCRYDRYPRRLLLDHFLGAAATSENFYACQYPEAGDFLTGVYEVIQEGYERRAGFGTVHLARNGFVEEAGSGRRVPVRVEKIFMPDDRDAVVRVRYVITNRGHEPADLRFGPELCFGASLLPAGLKETVDGPVRPFVSSPAGGVERGSAEGVRRLELAALEGGLRVAVTLDQPARWWWFPLETLLQEGLEIVPRTQGTVLLPWWEISLWGEESREIELSIEVLESIEAPVTVIEEE